MATDQTSMQFLLLFTAAFAESLVDIINNNPHSTWKAREYPPSILTFARFKTMLGAEGVSTNLDGPAYVKNEDLPENFSSFDKWTDLQEFSVRNQGSCGSCWAFATAETGGYRMTIAGCGQGDLAPQDLVSCDPLDAGCNGGNTLLAWTHMKYTGITTEECMPYVSGDASVPICAEKCADNSTIVRYKCDSFKHITADNMQEELYTNGPCAVSFQVYADFYAYSSGIYQYTTGMLLGGHAVVLVGYGTENGTDYWTIQNSWGPYWGESGMFRIIRGTNDCGIESNCYAPTYTCSS